MKNKMKFRSPLVAHTEARLSGHQELAFGQNGELNASSVQDLILNIGKLMQLARTVDLRTESDATTLEESRQMVVAAFNSKEAHAELGATLSDDLYVAAKRNGFMRRLLSYKPIASGTRPEFRVRQQGVTAIAAGSPTRLQSQIVRDKLYTPPEFYITARLFIEQREIDQSTTDVVEEKYMEGLTGSMVTEDRVWYRLANASVGVENALTTVAGNVTPTVLAALRNNVIRWNIPASTWLIATDIWNDIIADSGFQQLIDPVSKNELLLTGQLGRILGMEIITDGFRHQQHKVLNQGEMFIVGDPINHGVYGDRGGINSTPIDVSHEGMPGRGWVLTESMAMAIANARSVAKAIKP